jgi:hypothetical protein
LTDLLIDHNEGFLEGYTLPYFKAFTNKHGSYKEGSPKEIYAGENCMRFWENLEEFSNKLKKRKIILSSFRFGNYILGEGYSTIFNAYGDLFSLSITKKTKEEELTPFINSSICVDELSVYSPKDKVRLGMVITSDLPDLIKEI